MVYRGTLATVVCVLAAGLVAKVRAAEDLLTVPELTGHAGGRLAYSLRTAPKTLNPLIASDSASRDIIHQMHADLVHINRATLESEPALAKSYRISADGLCYTIELRKGLRFSDGQPFDADDVLFTFQVYLDARIGSAQRNLWILGGRPVEVRKLDQYRVEFRLPRVDAVGERIFDSVPILPRHLLERPYREGRLLRVWTLDTSPAEIAGLGPFRLKHVAAGQRVVLERNPYYWKRDSAGTRLPYLAELDFSPAGTEEMEVMRFQAGESDVLNRIAAKDYAALARESERHGYVLRDAGPGFEYSFLFFNLGSPAAERSAPARQEVWRRVAFRKAVSAAIDREAIVRLVYRGYASPLGSPVAAGNRPWVDSRLPAPRRSVAAARALLAADGFRWSGDGALLDAGGRPVAFSIIASSTNAERTQMATLIQADLKDLGIAAEVVPLEFRSLVDRVTRTHDFEACISAIGSADADPTADLNLWLSSGAQHYWNPSQKRPATAWEAEIDGLMEKQMVTRDRAARKRMFDRVQEIAMENVPLIPLATPHLLAGAKKDLANFRPAALDPYTLWNAEELCWRAERQTAGRAR